MSQTVTAFTRPVSGWDLLERIKQVFKEEPLRCRMSGYLWRQGENNRSTFTKYPPCGTVGCIAGWGAVLLGRANRRINGPELVFINGYVLALDLFMPVKSYLNWMDYTKAQTPEYVEDVVRHIEEFQQENEALLKNSLCYPGPNYTQATISRKDASEQRQGRIHQ